MSVCVFSCFSSVACCKCCYLGTIVSMFVDMCVLGMKVCVCVSVWSFHLSLQAAAPSLKHVDKMQLMKQFWISQSQRCTCCPLLTSSSLSFSSTSAPHVHHLLHSLLTSPPTSPFLSHTVKWDALCFEPLSCSDLLLYPKNTERLLRWGQWQVIL